MKMLKAILGFVYAMLKTALSPLLRNLRGVVASVRKRWRLVVATLTIAAIFVYKKSSIAGISSSWLYWGLGISIGILALLLIPVIMIAMRAKPDQTPKAAVDFAKAAEPKTTTPTTGEKRSIGGKLLWTAVVIGVACGAWWLIFDGSWQGTKDWVTTQLEVPRPVAQAPIVLPCGDEVITDFPSGKTLVVVPGNCKTRIIRRGDRDIRIDPLSDVIGVWFYGDGRKPYRLPDGPLLETNVPEPVRVTGVRIENPSPKPVEVYIKIR